MSLHSTWSHADINTCSALRYSAVRLNCPCKLSISSQSSATVLWVHASCVEFVPGMPQNTFDSLNVSGWGNSVKAILNPAGLIYSQSQHKQHEKLFFGILPCLYPCAFCSLGYSRFWPPLTARTASPCFPGSLWLMLSFRFVKVTSFGGGAPT